MDGQLITQFDRLPPYDTDAEMCVIGSMAIDKNAVPVALSMLGAEDFFQPDNAEYFRVLADLWRAGTPADSVTVREELIGRGKFDECGGIAYLATVLGAVPSSGHIEHYAGIVKNCAVWRGLIISSNEILRRAYDPHKGETGVEAVQSMIAELSKLTAAQEATRCVRLDEVAGKVFEEIAEGRGVQLVKTGVATIDKELGGIGRGEVMIIGARPSMGKSTLGRQIAASAAMFEHVPTAIISNEESREKIARNLLSNFSQVENSKLRRGGLSKAELHQLSDGLAKLGGHPIYIIDRAFRMNAIHAALSIAVARHGVRLVVIDYLQRIRSYGKDRYEQVTNASLEVSHMVKDLNVAAVVMAQLKREVANRQDKRPTMSDLRESGQIEQDADQIVFLHREDYYRKTGEADGEMDRVAELILAKVRDGVRGDTLKMQSNLRYQWFDELETVDPF